MEAFCPGADFQKVYRHYLWVCINPQPRSFEQCDQSMSLRVWQALLKEVQMQGLAGEALVLTSGCLMGCKAEGTTVLLATQQGPETQHALQFFRNVTEADVSLLVKQLRGSFK